MTPHCGTKPHCKTNWFHNVETVETDWLHNVEPKQTGSKMWNQKRLTFRVGKTVPHCGTIYASYPKRFHIAEPFSQP